MSDEVENLNDGPGADRNRRSGSSADRSAASRNPDRPDSDRPDSDRPDSDRPDSDRPDRGGPERGDRPFRDRSGGSSGDRPDRGGDRPYSDRADRSSRGRSDREERPVRDRPERGADGAGRGRPYSDRSSGGHPGRGGFDRGDRPFRDGPDRSGPDRPFRDRSDRAGRSFGDRPGAGSDRSGRGGPPGERPYRDRPGGGDRPFRDRPERGSDRGEDRNRPFRDRPGGGDRPFRARPERGSERSEDRNRSFRDRPAGGGADRDGRSYRDRSDRGTRPGGFDGGDRSDRAGGGFGREDRPGQGSFDRGRGRERSERPFRDRPGSDRLGLGGARSGAARGDRPIRDRSTPGDRPDGDRFPPDHRSGNDRPFRDRAGSDRPFRDRAGGDRSFRGRPGGDRTAGRGGSDRGPRGGGERNKRAWGTYQKAEPDRARRAAFDVLVSVASRDAYANLALPPVLEERRISGRDAALVTELTYGTLRHRGTLDAILAAGSSRPMDQVDLRVLQALRLGAYQLLFTRIPEHAAVSATVEVARVALTDGPARFVNAVLRRVAERGLDEWLAEVTPDVKEDPIAHLAVRYSHPEWVIRAFADALGEDIAALATGESETAKALAANNERPTVELAARPGRIEPEELAEIVGGEPGRWSPVGVRLPEGDPGSFPPIVDGRAHVQDEGSQLCAWTLANAPLDGEDTRWLDLCAGPGGKAGLLAAVAAQRGAHLTAVEVAEHRAQLVGRAVAGFPADVLTIDGRDVGERPELPEGGFDRVLVDAPCTGLGALRRRPEARWRKQPSDVPVLTKLQRELLLSALRAVRVGGLVAYVTCSPHLAETRVMVADVCRRTSAEPVDVRGVPAAATAAEANPEEPEGVSAARAASLQLWPHRHGTDAMFVSLLRRTK